MVDTEVGERIQGYLRELKSSSVSLVEGHGSKEGAEAEGGRRKREKVQELESTNCRKEGGEKMIGRGDSSEVRDLLVVLGEDIFSIILSHLDARSVAHSLLVSRAWHKVASSDRLWSSKLEELWMGKAHLPRSGMLRKISKLEAYSLSMMDGKRSRIMQDDICDHVWQFQFKQTAPDYWRNLDPFWQGTGSPMRRYFHSDGSQTSDPDDKVWGGHESAYSIVTSFVGDGRIREHYVRINRWPKMSVWRKPNWSWEMTNQLCCYSSIPDADKEGGTGPLFPVCTEACHQELHKDKPS
ncbi:hypothetical protein H6P81_013845 [Aristolochia fimbriata]|uniref:F-box domain-containing protein n=1 Tax=Aristolochia fimbriata TaxID=158543 RepID=A0AAV7EJF6_ARIFI|nr:hypothetical protein H6P81_013845 [Aristolochia fimbriata]